MHVVEEWWSLWDGREVMPEESVLLPLKTVPAIPITISVGTPMCIINEKGHS